MMKLFTLALLVGLFGLLGLGCGGELGQEPQVAPSPVSEPAPASADDSAARGTKTPTGAEPELSHNGACLLIYNQCASGADKCKQCLCKNNLELCMTPPGHLYDCAAYCDGSL